MILNLSPIKHAIDGVVNDPEMDRVILTSAFNGIPTLNEMETKALVLALSAKGLGYNKVLVNNAPYFIPILVETLKQHNITPVFAVVENNEYIGLLEY